MNSTFRPRTLVALVATALILFALFAGMYWWRLVLKGQSQGWPQQAVAVSALQLVAKDAPRTLNAVAELSAVQQVTLSAEAAGRVVALDFDSGDKVAKGGQVLALFSDPEQAQLATAMAQLTFAKAQYQRAAQLAPVGAESKELLNQRQAELEQANARVQSAQAALRLKVIKAPFAGQLGIRQVNLGQYLSPGTSVATLTDLSRLYVGFSVPQQAVAELAPHMPVTFTTDAYPGQVFHATVNAIEPQVDKDTRNVRIQALFDNANAQLRPGMYVAATLDRSPQHQALLVPVTAVQTSAQGSSVVRVAGDKPLQAGVAELVPVQLGRRIGNEVVITQGLKAGDVIVTAGQNRIQPQAPLKVTLVQEGDL